MRAGATLFIFACLCSKIRGQTTKKPVEHEITNKVFLDVVQKDTPLGRIVIGLYEKDTPITAGYFRQLATTGINDTFLVGSKFHKIVPDFKIQAGEGMDINLVYDEDYGCSYTVQEEEGKVSHSQPGIVSLAARVAHMKWTEFFITTIATPWLDYHDVAFGKVLEGMDVVHKIEKTKITVECRPKIPIIIKNCGLLPMKKLESTDNKKSVKETPK